MLWEEIMFELIVVAVLSFGVGSLLIMGLDCILFQNAKGRGLAYLLGACFFLVIVVVVIVQTTQLLN